ncbi:MAG: dihydropteroate synthase [Candidatus Omnitrophica bacterium]|nr:dihydropteroate synthase [Candidatus Omnitrophota bacterium]MCM8809391.1 dihydropteroate synthase [Candidatus Omnitrophota bacterium]MCM8810187.1 dihydropteroate synthase [Candidatus Omnitrophota bacterium]MCM8832644.1 dihydropteroate synthase [Candidatus Omnitrophota bacterium]
MNWKINNNILEIKKPFIMGILNVTPDSFYDGGKFFDFDKAIERGIEIEKQGADIIDIGGQSTRPGSKIISEEEEIERIIPVIKVLSGKLKIPISCDTFRSKVAEKAIENGAKIINDISAFSLDKNLLDVIKNSDCGYVLMHMKGTPENMQINPYYDNVIKEISDFFQEKLLSLEKNNIDIERVVIDPGIGFGKRVCDNVEILKNLDKFKKFNRPILIGTSRKSFIGKLLNLEVEQRLEPTIATNLYAYLKGANIFRVHDVREVKKAIEIIYLIENENIMY